jgi:hypothetical protein
MASLDLDHPPEACRPYVDLYERTRKDLTRELAANTRLVETVRAVSAERDAALASCRVVADKFNEARIDLTDLVDRIESSYTEGAPTDRDMIAAHRIREKWSLADPNASTHRGGCPCSSCVAARVAGRTT